MSAASKDLGPAVLGALGMRGRCILSLTLELKVGKPAVVRTVERIDTRVGEVERTLSVLSRYELVLKDSETSDAEDR